VLPYSLEISVPERMKGSPFAISQTPAVPQTALDYYISVLMRDEP
jgi:hypothetical protein